MYTPQIFKFFKGKSKQKIRKTSKFPDVPHGVIFEERENYFYETVFKPFSRMWQIMLTLTITYACMFNINFFMFTGIMGYFKLEQVVRNDILTILLISISEGYFLFDLILLTLHKWYGTIRITMPYKPTSITYLILGYITVIPSLLGMYEVVAVENFLSYLRLLILLRLYRIVLVYKYLLNSTRLNVFIVICAFYTLICILLSVLACLIIYFWLNESKEANLNAEEIILRELTLTDTRVINSWPIVSESDMLIWAYYTSGSTIFTRGPITIEPDRFLYLILFQMWILLTVVIRFGMIGIFSALIVKNRMRSVQFTTTEGIFLLKVRNMDLPKATFESIVRWFATLWETREGIINTDLCSKVLPFGLYQECCHDSYNDAFKHSKIFRNIDMTFAAVISMHMETVFHSEGDVFLNKGLVRSAMFYVYRGAVQIMSTYDSKTPIVTLFPGSCFGESTLVVSYPIRNEVVCASYCELKVLTKEGLLNASKQYPKELRKLRDMIKKRYEKARLLVAMKKINQYRNINRKVGIHEDGSLKRIKRIARNIDKVSQLTSYNKLDQEDKLDLIANTESIKPEYIGSCSEYLDSFAISESQNVIGKQTFISPKFPIILNPNSLFVRTWHFLVLISIMTMLFMIPIETSMGAVINNFHYGLSFLIQFIFILDMVFQCSFAIITYEKKIIKMKQIVDYRMNTIQFRADFIGSIPFCFMAQLTDNKMSWSTWGLLKLNYILRSWRVIKVTNETLARSFLYREYLVLLQLTIYFICFICYVSMFYSIISCFDQVCDPDAMWAMIEGTLERLDKLYATTRTILNIMLLCLGQGCGYIMPYTLLEHIIGMIVSFAFLFLDTYILAAMCAIVILTENIHMKENEKIGPVLNLVTKYNLPSQLQHRIFREVKHKKLVNKIAVFQGTENKDMPLYHKLINDIKLSAWVNIIIKVPLFSNTRKDFIKDIVDIGFVRMFPPNEIITYSGMLAGTLYIIVNGYCEILDPHSEKIEGVKGPGWSFGIVEVLFGIPFIKTIRSQTSVACFLIHKEQMLTVLKRYPNYADEVDRTKQKCEAFYNLPVVEDIGEIRKIKLEKKKSFYNFGYDMTVGSKVESEFIKPFGKYTILSYFLLHSVIHPSSNIIWILEIFRNCFAFLSCLLFPASAVLLFNSRYYVILFNFLDITAYIDIYIRLHVGYYNEKGLLIKHPLLTAINYLKTSFVVDLLGCIPLEKLFGKLIDIQHVEQWLRFNRIIQIHRIIGFNKHINSCEVVPSLRIKVLRYLIIIVVVVNLLGSTELLRRCSIHTELHKIEYGITWSGIECPTVIFTDIRETITPSKMYMYFQFKMITIITQMNILQIGKDESRGYFTMGVCILGYVMMVYMTGQIAAHTCLQNTGLTYQQNVKRLMKFLNQNKVSKELQDEFSLFYNTLWDHHRGTNPKSALSLLNISLYGDVIYHIYGRFLKEYTIFANSTMTFFRELLMTFNAKIYHKGAVVITEGHIHNQLFLLYDGIVTVNVKGRSVKVLTKGSFFGNLYDKNFSKQPATISANTTVEVLVLRTALFYDLLNAYPHYKNTYIQYLQENTAYGLCYITSNQNLNDGQEETTGENQFTQVKFKEEKSSFQKTTFGVFKVMLALVSSLSTFYTIAIHEFTVISVTFHFVIDLITLITIIINCYMPYVNDFGEYETKLKKIRDKYKAERYGFWFDLLTVFPFECVWFLFNNKSYAYLFFRFNRVFRYICFAIFLTDCYKKISAKQFIIRIGSLIINICTYIYIATSLFLTIYLIMDDTCIRDTSLSRLVQYSQHLMSQFSQFAHHPYSISLPTFGILPLLFQNIQMILNRLVIIMMMGHALFYIETFYFDILHYLETCHTILSIFKLQNISTYMYNNVNSYLHYLWDLKHKSQHPDILSLAPKSLQQKLMKTLYEHHLRNHFIFCDSQPSFIDHILLHLTRELLLPGNTIIRQGTKNNIMYFIHRGIVRAYRTDKTGQERFAGELIENMFFGTSQGLNSKNTHLNTYKAYSVVVVLKLDFHSWSYLLKHYPREITRMYRVLNEEVNFHNFND